MSDETAIVPAGPQLPTQTPFASMEGFQGAMEIAKTLAESSMVPRQYVKNVPNCLIAMELATRTNSSVFAVMQSCHIIDGSPSWASSFIAGVVNASGRFAEKLQYRLKGTGMDMECTAFTKDFAGELVEGPKVTMKMAQAEGWIGRKGSKWKTMPEVMIRYRSAAFFGRLHVPDLLLGMHTDHEIRDTIELEPEAITEVTGEQQQRGMDALRSHLAEGQEAEQEPGGQAAAPAPTESGGLFGNAQVINEQQQRVMFKRLADLVTAKGGGQAAQKEAVDILSEHLKVAYGVEKSEEILSADYEGVMNWINHNFG